MKRIFQFGKSFYTMVAKTVCHIPPTEQMRICLLYTSPFVIHAVGMYFGHSKLVAAELWDFNIGGKGRNHEDDAVRCV